MKQVYVLIAASVFAVGCAAQTTNDGAAGSSPAQQMQSRMDEMHALMARIRAAEDPAERQRLMAEHMRLMHEGMGMMQGMMMRGAGAAGEPQCAEGDMQCRMQRMQAQQGMMGQRMGMMQMMMQEMMDHMMQQGGMGSVERADQSARDGDGADQNHE